MDERGIYGNRHSPLSPSSRKSTAKDVTDGRPRKGASWSNGNPTLESQHLRETVLRFGIADSDLTPQDWRVLALQKS